MTQELPDYTFIGRGSTLKAALFSGSQQRLYSSPDHLLVLEDGRSEETHKKFYFNDIEAITVRSNPEQDILLLIQIASLAIIGGLGIFLGSVFPPARSAVYLVFGIVMLWPLLYLIKNLLSGPTCTVRLHTAVQVEELCGLRRLKKALEAIKLLQYGIDKAQGTIPEEEFEELLDSGTFKATSKPPISFEDVEIKIVGPMLHRIAFGCVFLSGLTCFVDYAFAHDYKNNFDSLLYLFTLTILFVGIIRQVNSTIPSEVSRWTWMTFMYCILSFVFMIGFAVVETIQYPGGRDGMFSGETNPASQWPMTQQLFYGIYAALHVFFGFMGTLLLQGYRIVKDDPIVEQEVPSEVDS